MKKFEDCECRSGLWGDCRRRIQPRPQQLGGRIQGLLTTTVLEANFVHPVIVNDDKVVTRCVVGVCTLIACSMAQLDAKPDLLQSCRFEECPVPLLRGEVTVSKNTFNIRVLDSPRSDEMDLWHADPQCTTDKTSRLRNSPCNEYREPVCRGDTSSIGP